MKILYIVTQGEQGGAQKYISDMAPQMQKKGHNIFVAVGAIENEGDNWLFESLQQNEIFKFAKENLFELNFLQREIKFFRDIKSLFEMIKLFKIVKPDIVHLHSSKAGVVGAVACFVYNIFFGKTRAIYTVHGFVFLEPMNIFKKNVYIFLEFISARFRDFTILITEKDILVGKKFLILNKNYKLIYNGISDKIKSEMLEASEAREFIFNKIGKKDEGQKIVGTISNLYKTKGLGYLIDAAKLIVEKALAEGGDVEGGKIIFIVLGFGEENYKKELEEKIKINNLQNNFFLLGKTPNASKYLKAFNVFTLTSVKEGLPYTLLEAKMAGVPIIASSVGGIPEMAKNIEMNLIQAKVGQEKSEETANKILYTLKEDVRVDNNLPQIYSLENMVNETEKVYKF